MTAVSVSQQDGEIVLTKPGDPAIVYPVTKGVVDVPEDEVGDFLSTIPGAEIATVKAKADA